MKQATVAVLIIQLLSAVAAAFAATVELESILVSGPILSLLGLVFAWLTLHRQSWNALAFGLSAPLTCALCATLIAVFRWGPDWTTGWPVVVIFVLYAILLAPLATVVVLALKGAESHSQPPATWQFDMKTMLVFTTGMCLLIAGARFLAGFGSEEMFFGGFAAVCIAMSSLIAWKFSVLPRATKTPGETGG